jgi:diguanylate cyclase (GGDEF)-like protein
MHTNKKVLVIIVVMLSVLSVATILNVWVNFIDYGKKSTVDKAHAIAEGVRDGLTSHMTLGAMDKRDIFLDNMIKHQKVKSLRVVRSNSVIKEYGVGSVDLYKYDDIEKMVLKSGKSITKVNENIDDTLRITIPYIATKNSNPNCLSCHSNIKAGEVLGAISLELDIKEVRDITVDTIIKIIIISIVFLVLAIFITGYYIKPYVKLFDDLEEGISKAYTGDYSHYVTTTLSNEAGKVAKRLNDLSEIFRFKKTIELDNSKDKIYERISFILKENFSLQEFVIFENDIALKKRKIVVKSKELDELKCEELEASKKVCRSFRTNLTVYSTDFHKICDLCYKKNKESVCITFNISEECSLTLLIYVDNEEELKRVKESVPIITNYFELIEPVLQTKILMEKLHEKSLRDGMTGLYNRRFLNNYVEEKISKGDDYSVFMIDIDFFKQVNDTYGHDVGDKIIIELSNVLKNSIKLTDIAIRYGGEEFLVISYNISLEESKELAEFIRKKFGEVVFKANTDSFSKTLSIGVAISKDNNSTAWQAIKYADVALYKAKNSGRNKVVMFEPSMYDEELI